MNSKRSIKERRKYVRLKANVEVKYTVIGRPGAINVFSKNISAGGICLLTEDELAKDTPLQLEIKIPDLQDAIRALGRVVWQRRLTEAEGKYRKLFDTGVEFTGISDFDRFNINRYVMDRIEGTSL